MEEGIYIFNDAEDFLQFIEELEEAYLNSKDGVAKDESK